MKTNGLVDVLVDVWDQVGAWQNEEHPWRKQYVPALKRAYSAYEKACKVKLEVSDTHLEAVGRLLMQLLVSQQHRFRLGIRQSAAFFKSVWRTFFGERVQILVPLWIPAGKKPDEEIYRERLNAVEHLLAFFDGLQIRVQAFDAEVTILVAGVEWLQGNCPKTLRWIRHVTEDLQARKLGQRVQGRCLVEFTGKDLWDKAVSRRMKDFLPRGELMHSMTEFDTERVLSGWLSQLIQEMNPSISNRCWLMLGGNDYYPAPEHDVPSICWLPRPEES
jgi:hypothetical protein